MNKLSDLQEQLQEIKKYGKYADVIKNFGKVDKFKE